jgi:hydroxyethylthiazole kinase
MELVEKIAQNLRQVREKKPLVHQITNYVTVNDCANITLAAGASPIMADDIGEVAEIVAISSALVLNIGTLNNRTIEAMIAAGEAANELGVPVVLDPVGAGASSLRTDSVKELLRRVGFAAVRGNVSEIRCIAGMGGSTKGVDASAADQAAGVDSVLETGRLVADRFGCVAALTGPVDVVCDKTRAVLIENGTSALSSITGTGCMCSALVGAFCGAGEDMLIAAAGGVAMMGISGELALKRTKDAGYGSFHTAILDAVSRMTPEVFLKEARIFER